MIKPNQFIALAFGTLASVIAAAAIYSVTNRWNAGKVEGALLTSGLILQEKTIASVEIAQGEKKVTLERAGEQWKIKERAGYPANAERVRALLNTIAKAELIEPKTAAKDRHKQLELEDPTAKDAKSRAVRILDAKGKALSEVVLGKTRHDAFGSGKGGVYVRRLNEAQTWLATGDPKGGTDLRDWVTVTVYELDQAKVQKVTIEHPGEEALVVEKGDGKEQKFKISAATPDGKKLKSGAIDQIPTGFSSIDFEDVRKAEAPPAGEKFSVVKLEAEGGVTVNFRIRRDGDVNWLSLTAAGGEGDAKKAADELNVRTGEWEYRIPQWKVDQIGKRKADLFEAAS